MKARHLLRNLLVTVFAACLPAAILAQDTIVHYDNLNDPGIDVGGREGIWHRKFGPETPGGGAAQKFTAGDSGAVTSVTMGLARLQDPGGKLIVSIREVDASDFPGQTIGILGDVEINSLQRLENFEALSLMFERVTISGRVDGLTPGEDYFLVLEDEDAIIDSTRGWLASTLETPTDADVVVIDWGPGGWQSPWTESHEYGPQHLHVRIKGEAQETVVHYDSLDGTTSEGRAFKVWSGIPSENGVAQKFTAGESGHVTSVTLGLGRFGSPGGRLIVGIWTVDAVTGNPGQVIGNVGEIEINSIPLVDARNLPYFLDFLTVEGLVTGLIPGAEYYLVVTHTEDAYISADINGGTSYVLAFVDTPVAADQFLVYDPEPLGWRFYGPQGMHLQASIEGTPPGPELKIDRAVQISWPESENAGVLEHASSPEGPWEPVTESVQTVDGEYRVTILSDAGNAYFRLREE